MFKWLHHLLNPHCSECVREKQCQSCDVLQQMVEQERHRNKQLMDLLITPREPVTQEPPTQRPIEPKQISWAARRKLLEEEDRNTAKILREKLDNDNRDVDKLEKELLVGDKNG